MRWDIFCQIVDNYGDAGVCWRLARSLSSIHGQEVRIFCDDLPTLNLLASGVDPEIKEKIFRNTVRLRGCFLMKVHNPGLGS